MTLANTRPWKIVRLGILSFRLDKRAIPALMTLTLILIFVAAVSIGYGEYEISLRNTLAALLGMDTGDSRHALVIWTFRMPRVITAFLVGMALAVSGTILQGITRNPLADPGIIGISSGASLAAVSVIVLFEAPMVWLPPAAFIGASTMAILIFSLAWKNGSSPARLIMTGIGLSALSSSITNLMIVFGDIWKVQEAQVWMAGSVYNSDWQSVRIIGFSLIVLLPITYATSRSLNVLSLGDELARGLGLQLEMHRSILLFLSVCLASISVSISGSIGFIGLMAPHIGRRLAGPSHEGLIPVSALLGGLLLLLSDLVARWIIAPSELPAGVVAAILGAPCFAFLLFYPPGKKREHRCS